MEETILNPEHAQSVQALTQLIHSSLDDDKAEDIVAIDLKGKSSFADAMVVASGRSQRHVASLANSIAQKLKETGHPVLSVEGTELCDWVLVDAGDVIVHIFRPEMRKYYNLEKMWSVALPEAVHA